MKKVLALGLFAFAAAPVWASIDVARKATTDVQCYRTGPEDAQLHASIQAGDSAPIWAYMNKHGNAQKGVAAAVFIDTKGDLKASEKRFLGYYPGEEFLAALACAAQA